MSTLFYDYIPKNTAAESDTVFSDCPQTTSVFLNEACVGQDARYIIRKRALILDLWNLQPDVQNSGDEKSCLFDLPVIIDNSKEFSFSGMERAIPVQ